MVLKADISNAFEPLVPCGDTPEGTAYYRLEARALGTVCTITFGAPHRRVACQYREQAGSWLAGFEKRYSRFRSDSLISQINQLAAHEPVGVDGELEGLFRLCDWYHWSSQGLFDPTMMPLNELWGFGTDGSQPRGAPTPQAVAQARALVGWRRVVREPGQVRFAQAGMGIDVGGIGKEYAVDRVTEMALALGIRNVLVDFGHDVRAHGSPPEGGVWRVGLEDPCDPGRCWGGVALQERAIATSGNYLRFREYGGERFGHLIDPRTGYPAATDCGAVSVVAPTCTEAGVLASCAVIMGSVAAPQWMASFNQATGALVTHRGVVRLPGFETIELGQKHASASGKE